MGRMNRNGIGGFSFWPTLNLCPPALAIALLLVFPQRLSAASLESAKPEALGLSEDGLVTMTDYLGERVLDRSTVEQMTQNRIGDRTVPFGGYGDGFGYGFGVLTQRGHAADVASVGTYSWGGVFNTYFWVDPQEELIGVLMTQVYPYNHLDVRSEFKRLAYEAIDDSGFYRKYWYEKGLKHGNPYFNGRQLRVNAPETSLHPSFGGRSEARSSGMARIRVEDDLREIQRAELYCEIWGGHPGTANKRVTVNGRNCYRLPEVGTAAENATHQYPRFNLPMTDLVNVYNSLQFACDQGETFWGHYIVDNVALKLGLPTDHPDLRESGLTDLQARLRPRSCTWWPGPAAPGASRITSN